jgi:uncharacterized protein YyaL (SSP411 family)
MKFPRFALAGLCLALGVRIPAAPSALSGSASVFLREQAASPVNWQPWDPALVQRAKDEGRPVYVFAGSFLSELSRATCRQTFANAEVAEFLNSNFICVLVDRDEQPAVAAAIQHFLRTIKQQDGWPAHLWLTPELQPYEGAGYLPPSEEWGKPSFLKVARQAREAWAGDPKACRARAADAVAMMKSPPDTSPPSSGPAPKIETQLTDAAAAWHATFDEANAGFGQAPKGAEPELLRFLLRQAARRRILPACDRCGLAAAVFSKSADRPGPRCTRLPGCGESQRRRRLWPGCRRRARLRARAAGAARRRIRRRGGRHDRRKCQLLHLERSGDRFGPGP